MYFSSANSKNSLHMQGFLEIKFSHIFHMLRLSHFETLKQSFESVHYWKLVEI